MTTLSSLSWLSALETIVGNDAIQQDADTLRRYAAGLSGTSVMPSVVVYPQNQGQIIALVALANRERLALYPLSQGKNFGYGTAQGTEEGQMIVNLSRMNEVVTVNEQLGYVTIQPGVTQVQLYEHLTKCRSRLQMDVTGAGKSASIVGNVLERGFGHTDYGDRFTNVLSMKVVLPNGEVLQTGFGDYPGARARHTYRYGLGPSVDGLFSQSNLGIITEMTLAMMPRPEKSCMFAFTTKREDALEALVEVIRELRLSGTVHSAVHIANRARVIGESPKKSMAGVWNLSGSISGPAPLVRAKRKVIKRIFRQHLRGQLWFVTDRLLKLMAWVDRHIQPLAVYSSLRDATDLQQGIPTDASIKTLFDDAQVTSQDLDVSSAPKCFRWISAVCPANPSDVRAMVSIVSTLFQQYGYTFRVTLTFVNPRSLIMITEIAYPNQPEAIREATVLYKECVAALKKQGYYPYRSGSGLYDHAAPTNLPIVNLLQQIKSVVDPNQILAPHKYNI